MENLENVRMSRKNHINPMLLNYWQKNLFQICRASKISRGIDGSVHYENFEFDFRFQSAQRMFQPLDLSFRGQIWFFFPMQTVEKVYEKYCAVLIDEIIIMA